VSRVVCTRCLTSGHDVRRTSRVRAEALSRGFRRKVLDLMAAGRPDARVTADLGAMSEFGCAQPTNWAESAAECLPP
jgi:hypothetical protein